MCVDGSRLQLSPICVSELTKAAALVGTLAPTFCDNKLKAHAWTQPCLILYDLHVPFSLSTSRPARTPIPFYR